jgi:Holliday junction DNA helicase RuvA
MIGHLRGKISDKRPNQVVVDVGGVGYEVFIPLSTFYALGELHQDVNLLIHTHVREDTLALYGFVTSREKQLFELLLSASGVGPVLALKILSGMSVDELLPAIRAGDLARLTTIPGVGRKTAERLVVELRDKMTAMEAPERRPMAATGRTQMDADVISALVNLGYDQRVAEKALAESSGQFPGGGAPTNFESLLRATLQGLSRPLKKGARSGAGD